MKEYSTAPPLKRQQQVGMEHTDEQNAIHSTGLIQHPRQHEFVQLKPARVVKATENKVGPAGLQRLLTRHQQPHVHRVELLPIAQQEENRLRTLALEAAPIDVRPVAEISDRFHLAIVQDTGNRSDTDFRFGSNVADGVRYPSQSSFTMCSPATMVGRSARPWC